MERGIKKERGFVKDFRQVRGGACLTVGYALSNKMVSVWARFYLAHSGFFFVKATLLMFLRDLHEKSDKKGERCFHRSQNVFGGDKFGVVSNHSPL